MAAGVGTGPTRCRRICATFHAHHPSCPTDDRAGRHLPLRQGVEGVRHPLRWAALPLLLSACTVLAADAPNPDDRGEIQSASAALPGVQPVVPSVAQPAGLSWRVTRTAVPVLGSPGLGGLPSHGGLPVGTPVRALQTMVWAVRPALQPGFGVEQRWTQPSALGSGLAGTPEVNLLVGLRLDAGPRAHLTWQTPLWRRDAQNPEAQPRQMRVALALLPQDPYADLRRGLLTKIELSGQTTLALRPRGGRFGVLLTSHW